MDQNQENLHLLTRKLSTKDVAFILSIFVIAVFCINKVGPLLNSFTKKELLAQVFGTPTLSTAVILPQEVLPNPPAGKVWILGFYDEFDGSNIDETKWNRLGDYVRRKGTNPFGYWIKGNSYLNGSGQLVLKTDLDTTIPGYRSGALDTSNKYTKKFGYISVRANFAKQPGHWGAFWMMTGNQGNVDNSAQDGAELDIVEKPALGYYGFGSIWDGYGVNLKKDGMLIATTTFDNGYHEFGFDWRPTMYKFYADGVEQFQSTGGGVSQKSGYILVTDEVDTWMTDIKNAVLPDYTYVDYVHAYESVTEPTFTYKISPGAHVTYPDSGSELNNGNLATSDLKNQEWVGIVGQPSYYFEISIGALSGLLPSQITLHMLSSKAPGIYIPKKIDLYCSGSNKVSWSVSQPSVDGMYQVILKGIPSKCSRPVLRLWNGWWTFLSEITLGSAIEDTSPPKVSFVSPLSSTTISGSDVSVSASVSDNVGVVGVQFKLDGAAGVNIGDEILVAPFTAKLDTTKYANGIHKITATARDATGNISIDIANNININNVVAVANNSTCSGVTAPSSVKAGGLFNASVVFTNAGTATWIDHTQGTQDYYAATTPDGSGWFAVFDAKNQFAHHWSQLQTTKVLASGKATFNYANITAPTVPGTYQLKFQMLQQNKGWFGSVCTQNVSVI